MSLAFGTGPLTRNGGRWSFEVPDHVWYLEDWPRRLRAVLAGETVLDTRRAKLLHESGRLPVHYIPLDDIDPHFRDDPEPGAEAERRTSP